MIDRLRERSRPRGGREHAAGARARRDARRGSRKPKARGAEVVALREERDLIRSRVGDMLAQIESLNL